MLSDFTDLPIHDALEFPPLQLHLFLDLFVALVKKLEKPVLDPLEGGDLDVLCSLILAEGDGFLEEGPELLLPLQVSAVNCIYFILEVDPEGPLLFESQSHLLESSAEVIGGKVLGLLAVVGKLVGD